MARDSAKLVGSIPDIFGSPASAHNCYSLGNNDPSNGAA